MCDISPRLLTNDGFSWLSLKPREGEIIPTEVIENTSGHVTPRDPLHRRPSGRVVSVLGADVIGDVALRSHCMTYQAERLI